MKYLNIVSDTSGIISSNAAYLLVESWKSRRSNRDIDMLFNSVANNFPNLLGNTNL